MESPIHLRALALLMLSSDPGTGTDVMKRVALVSEGKITMSPGAVYPLMEKLAKEGVIVELPKTRDNLHERRYQLTDEGRKEVLQIIELFRKFSQPRIEAGKE